MNQVHRQQLLSGFRFNALLTFAQNNAPGALLWRAVKRLGASVLPGCCKQILNTLVAVHIHPSTHHITGTARALELPALD